MPDQDHNRVNFDRDHIKSKITKLSLKEARRLQGPIYDVLLRELYEEACMTTAKYFKCLVAKEKKLIQQHFTGYHVRDELEFLITVFENFRLAELSYRLKKAGGQLATLKIFYQTLLLCERYRSKFEWLVTDIHDIVINLMKGFPDNEVCFNEMKMRIYYKYGTYIETTGQRLERAITYLDKSFELTKGETWAPDVMPEREIYKTMYEAIPQKLATVLLTHAERVFKTNPEKALELANFAVATLSAGEIVVQNSQNFLNSTKHLYVMASLVSWKENKFLACKAILSKTLFEIECQKYDMALSDAIKIQPQLVKEERSEFFRMRSEIFWYKGFCLYSLHQEDKAMESLRIGYDLAYKYKIRDLQAEILLSIGRTYGKNPKHINRALEAYTSARRIFDSLNDKENKMKTTYLMAKLKADQLFPLFLNLIQASDYCKYYSLRRWKNQVKPFWQVDMDRGSVDESIRSRPAAAVEESVQGSANESGEDIGGESKSLQESLKEDEDEIVEENFFETVENFPRFHWDEKKQIALLNRTQDLDCLLKEFENK